MNISARAARLLGFALATYVVSAHAAEPVRAGPTTASAPDPIKQCLADLKAAEVEFQDLGSATKEDCKVEGAIELDALASPFGKVAFPAKPTMTCAFARQFTAFVRDVAAPLTFAYLGAQLTAIETGPGFVCRTRYNKPGEKISEHAKGDAIDVVAFHLDNEHARTVKDASASAGIDGVWIRTLRAAACGYFTTILGPGSNEAHKEHLHFDYEMRGGTFNYRICE